MRQLAGELKDLVEQAGIPAPAIRKILGPDLLILVSQRQLI
jgi:hypothetical protein